MKVLRYLGLAAGALVALALLLAGAVALLFDPNDYKAQLQRAVEQRTGRSLQLPGRLELSWFPWLAIEFGPATLGNAPGAGPAPFLEIGRARLGVRLGALLSRRRLEFDTVRIERPVLRLAVDDRGRDNWSDLVERLSNAPAPSPTAEPASSLEVAFSGVEIEGGRLEFTDARDDSRVELLDVGLRTGALHARSPFELQSRFTWRTDPSSAVATELGGRASIDPDRRRVRLESPRVELRWRGAGAPEQGVPASVRSGPVELDYASGLLAVPGLVVESLGARLEGEIAGSGLPEAPRFTGPLRLATVSPRQWLQKAGIEAPATRDPAVLGALAFEARLVATPKSLELGQLALRLDDSSMNGSAGIPDLDADVLPLRFDLDVDRMDLERYLAPEAAGDAADGKPARGAAGTPARGAPAAAPRPDEPFLLPVDTLRGLDLVGQLRLGRGRIAGLPVAALKLGIDARESKLRLAPLEARIHGGTYRGDLRVDVSGAEPRLSFDEKLEGIELGPLLADLFDARRFSGRGTGTIKGEARGADPAAWLRSASGEARFAVADGAIEGADLWYEIRRARAVLRREAVPARPAGAARTPFTRLQASARLGGGALRSEDLAMDLQYLRVAGRGQVDLVAGTIDGNLDAKVLRIPDADAGLREIVDFTVPIRVTGALDSPTVRPDLAGLAKARVREELEKRRGALDEKKGELEQKLRDRLQDLFKR